MRPQYQCLVSRVCAKLVNERVGTIMADVLDVDIEDKAEFEQDDEADGEFYLILSCLWKLMIILCLLPVSYSLNFVHQRGSKN